MNIGAFEQAGTHGARMDLVVDDIDGFFRIRTEIENDHPQVEVLRCRHLLRPFDDDQPKGKYILPDDVEPKDFSCCVSYYDDGSVAVSEANGLSVSGVEADKFVIYYDGFLYVEILGSAGMFIPVFNPRSYSIVISPLVLGEVLPYVNVFSARRTHEASHEKFRLEIKTSEIWAMPEDAEIVSAILSNMRSKSAPTPKEAIEHFFVERGEYDDLFEWQPGGSSDSGWLCAFFYGACRASERVEMSEISSKAFTCRARYREDGSVTVDVFDAADPEVASSKYALFYNGCLLMRKRDGDSICVPLFNSAHTGVELSPSKWCGARPFFNACTERRKVGTALKAPATASQKFKYRVVIDEVWTTPRHATVIADILKGFRNNS